jgi:hypothetical protein
MRRQERKERLRFHCCQQSDRTAIQITAALSQCRQSLVFEISVLAAVVDLD